MALTCLDIISDAMRELTILPSGKAPKASESADCLKRLQSIVDGLFGVGVGATLSDEEISSAEELEADTRALVYATSAITLTLPESPFNGARIQVKDMSGNFATYNVTINPNSRLVEGAALVTLNTNGADRTWVYIADTANWVQVAALSLTDSLPLNDDEYFTLQLAKRIAPMFGAKMGPESIDALRVASNRIKARFATQVVIPCDDAVLNLSDQSYNVGLDGL